MKPKSKKQPNKQGVAFDYIKENYLDSDRLRHDEISDQVQIQNADGTWRDFTTKDIHDIVVNCSLESGVAITAKEVQAVTLSNHVPTVNPLRDYVTRCGEEPKLYDPTKPNCPDWIDWFAQFVTVEGDEEEQLFWRQSFKKWFVAMVVSWLVPEVANHQVLVLIGKQGVGKTTWLDHILPPELRAYNSKMHINAYMNKDEKLRVAEFGLINIDEIDTITSNRALNMVKSLITTTDVDERAAWRYNKEKRTRIASFCASGNNPQFLTDLTGNRRWLVFTTTYIQSPLNMTIPYENIYAQAYYLYQHDFQYWFDQEENSRLDAHNEAYRDQPNEEQLIPRHMRVPLEGEEGEFLSTAAISSLLQDRERIKTPLSPSRLGMLMRKLGFKESRTSRVRGYIVKVISHQEAFAPQRVTAEA